MCFRDCSRTVIDRCHLLHFKCSHHLGTDTHYDQLNDDFEKQQSKRNDGILNDFCYFTLLMLRTSNCGQKLQKTEFFIFVTMVAFIHHNASSIR